jgi:UDP-N-acetylmuramate dehydrogenase
LKNDLTGLEFLSGVPGTIGGAVACNARAYFLGKFLKKPTCVGDVLKKIVVLTPQGKFNQYSGSHYPHTLSESSIKKSGDVILSVVFELKKGVSQRAKQYLKDYESYRQDKPYRQYPTPGSIFQNPAGKSAGWLIDNCGLKGKIIGQAQISPQHANFIVNLGKAKAADVLALINLAKDQVKKKYRLTLKEEICFLGFDRI